MKWLFREADTPSALALRDDDTDFIAPDLILAEIGNAAWKKCIRGEIDAEQAVFAIRRIPLLFSLLVPLAELAETAMRLSAELPHPIYDCFYLALAERERAPVVSADAKLLTAAKRLKRVKARRL